MLLLLLFTGYDGQSHLQSPYWLLQNDVIPPMPDPSRPDQSLQQLYLHPNHPKRGRKSGVSSFYKEIHVRSDTMELVA